MPDRFSYVLPLAAKEPYGSEEFASYLRRVSQLAELIVVDGSPSGVFAENGRLWGSFCRHVAPRAPTSVGKVGGVVTGVLLASSEHVVIADDDVRFGDELLELVGRLEHADVVRPQNYFDPLSWHAAWDSGRSLLNRVTGGDWPGTLAVRRSTFLRAGGYADVMFENYELVQTICAVGGREGVADDLFVRRLPPTTRHFFTQRVRQAYDEFARPLRLVAFLSVLPLTFVLACAKGRGALRPIGLSAAAVAALAECGRRRDGATAYFPFRCSLAAPLWVLERSVSVWVALVAWCGGGVRYRGRRIKKAALRPSERRRRLGELATESIDGSAETINSFRSLGK